MSAGNEKFDFEVIQQGSTDTDIINNGTNKAATLKSLEDQLAPLIGSLNRMMEDGDVFHGKLQNEVTTLNEGLVSLTKTVENIGKQLVTLQTSHNTLVERQFQIQTLEWAIQNAHLGSFSYWDGMIYRNSKDIIPSCMLHFKSNMGFEIKETLFGEGSSEFNKQSDFRDKLRKQIKMLTGVSPCFSKVNNTKWIVSLDSTISTPPDRPKKQYSVRPSSKSCSGSFLLK